MPPLPRLVVWVVRHAVPASRRDTAVADLADDFAKVSQAKWYWLARETTSLASAYILYRATATARGLPMLTRDIQLVLRGLRHGSGPLVASIFLLAVGIAAVLVSAGLADTLLLRPVSATHGTALRRVVATDRDGRLATRFSYTELRAMHDQVAAAGALTAVNLQPVLVRTTHTDIQTMVEAVEGDYFTLLGTRAIVGRTLLAHDHRLDLPPSVVIAAPFWRRQFAAAPDVIGRTLLLNGAGYTVVGVADTMGSSVFLGASVDAWVPLAHADPLLNPGWRTNVADRWFTPFVLPAPDLAEVESRLARAQGDLARVHGEPWRNRRLHTTEATAAAGPQRSAATLIWLVLSGLAVLILAAATANVSSVLLARAATRQRAAAIHMSMGASRQIVVRRQLIEGALVGGMAAILALGLYAWGRVQLTEITVLPTLALRLDLPLSASLILGALLVGTGAGLLLAIWPSLWSTRADIVAALRDSNGRSGDSPRVGKWRRALVSAQVCLTLVLIIGASLFLRSVAVLNGMDLGFPRERLVALDFDVEPRAALSDGGALGREALVRVERLPGIVAAAMSNRAPVDQSTPSVDVQLPTPDSPPLAATMNLATEAYFETVGIPLIAGRAFTSDEVTNASDVVIVNETLARRLWDRGDAVGRAVVIPSESRTLRVVGVARDAKYRTLTEAPQPHLYRPTPPLLRLTLLARTSNNPRESLRSIQRALDAVGPGVVGFFPRTLDDHLAVQTLPARAAANAATALGVMALALSAAALYGLISWFVVLRRREFGVRLALGARPRDIRALVARQTLAAVGPGVLAGLILAMLLARAADAALPGVSASDPLAVTAGIGALVLMVLVAGYFPSRAATTVDPAEALRD